MTIIICEKRQQILEATGHVLVLGGPGSGKTTIALKKAARMIDEGLQPGQAILFLSFSRAAVARIAEVSKTEVERTKRQQLSIQTLHSFCWDILQSHVYLVGSPKGRLMLLLPHDEKALSGGLKPPAKGQIPSVEWSAWLTERERLFVEEGKIVFDLFAQKTANLLSRCSLVRELVADCYPVIIVDEAQDTNADAWRCIEILSAHSQIICLGDLDQQIFDHLEGVGPERIQYIQNVLQPLSMDLGSDNNRSPGTEIAIFADDIFSGAVRGSSYAGVSRQMYDPQADPAKRLRSALSQIYRLIKRATGKWPDSIAILTSTGTGVARVSAALNNETKPVRHKVFLDEAATLLSARVAAFLLEPKSPENAQQDVAKCFELLADVRRSTGSIRDAEKYMKWANAILQGKNIRAQLPLAVINLINSARAIEFYGDPSKDWVQIKHLLRASNQKKISRIASDLDYLIAFNRGKRIAANLSTVWINEGCYMRAREALEAALIEDQLYSGIEDLRGNHVMTIHKSKGKEFDGVIIVREDQKLGAKQGRSTLVWRDDPPPHHRSRKILHVGITRAKSHVLLLEPSLRCPILSPHSL